jgi:hypothetical protein
MTTTRWLRNLQTLCRAPCKPGLLPGLLAALAALTGPPARADVINLTNGGQSNLIDIYMADPSGNVLTRSFTFNQDTSQGSSTLPFTGSYSDSFTSASASDQVSKNLAINNPAGGVLTFAASDNAQESTLTPGWVSQVLARSTDAEYFTLTSAYRFTLHEQGVASLPTGSLGYASAGGYLSSGSTTYANWAITQFDAGTLTRDVFVTGVLNPGTYIIGTGGVAYGDTPGTLTTGYSQQSVQQTLTLTAVPEPASLTLLGVGSVLGLAGNWWATAEARRRRRPCVP